MPSRGMILAVVLGWLGTTGWLAWHDLWPYWRPGQPPPFDIDIVDEVQREQQSTLIWDVRCDGPGKERQKEEQYQALTRVEYRHKPDLFVLQCELQVRSGLLDPLRPKGIIRPNYRGSFGVNNYIVSSCSIDRGGRLHAFSVQVTGQIAARDHTKSPPIDEKFASLFSPDPSRALRPFILDLSGEVSQEQFRVHAEAASEQTQLAGDLPGQPVEYFGAILMPLHPLHRIGGLRPGRHWTLPMIHPFQTAMHALDARAGQTPERVQARVWHEPVKLTWDGKVRHCLVVDYKGDGMSGSTWVEEDSGRVLLHEMTLERQTWTFERRPAVAARSNYTR